MLAPNKVENCDVSHLDTFRSEMATIGFEGQFAAVRAAERFNRFALRRISHLG